MLSLKTPRACYSKLHWPTHDNIKKSEPDKIHFGLHRNVRLLFKRRPSSGLFDVVLEPDIGDGAAAGKICRSLL